MTYALQEIVADHVIGIEVGIAVIGALALVSASVIPALINARREGKRAATLGVPDEHASIVDMISDLLSISRRNSESIEDLQVKTDSLHDDHEDLRRLVADLHPRNQSKEEE